MDSSTPSNLREESAFTLLEVVIAATLGAIVLTMVVLAVTTLMSGVTTAQTGDRARRMSQEFVDTLSVDLRTARARDRAGFDAPSALTLRDALQGGTTLYSSDGRELDVEDVVRATPTQLVFQSDVASDPTTSTGSGFPECVEYGVVTAGGAWSVTRSVWRWQRGCPSPPSAASTIDRSVIVGPVSIAGTGLPVPTAANPLFSYGYFDVQPNGQCPIRSGTQPNAQQRNGIIEITVSSFAARQSRGRSVSEHETQMSVALVTRQSEEYRTALGCA